MKIRRSSYIPLPPIPIPSLTTEDGFAVSVLENTGSVRGIYGVEYRRVKIDLITQTAMPLTQREIDRYPTDYVFEHSSSIVCLVPHTHCNPWQSH